MGRKCAFDRTSALQSALKLFWIEGYDKATLEELQLCMEIKTSSFYNSFESKEKLFFEVLQYYRQSVGRERLIFLADEKLSCRDSLLNYFDHLVQGNIKNSFPAGCFMMKTAANLSDPESNVGLEVANSISKVEKSFADTLTRGKKNKELPRKLDIPAISKLLLISAYGISVLSRTKKSKKELASSAEAFIKLMTQNI